MLGWDFSAYGTVDFRMIAENGKWQMTLLYVRANDVRGVMHVGNMHAVINDHYTIDDTMLVRNGVVHCTCAQRY